MSCMPRLLCFGKAGLSRRNSLSIGGTWFGNPLQTSSPKPQRISGPDFPQGLEIPKPPLPTTNANHQFWHLTLRGGSGTLKWVACVPQSCPFTVSFLGEGSPTNIDYRTSWYPYSNLSTGGPSSRGHFPILSRDPNLSRKPPKTQ